VDGDGMKAAKVRSSHALSQTTDKDETLVDVDMLFAAPTTAFVGAGIGVRLSGELGGLADQQVTGNARPAAGPGAALLLTVRAPTLPSTPWFCRQQRSQ
jgi:hypothetical protein